MPAKSTTKKSEPAAAKPGKPSVTKAQLTKAAKMRAEGATWNAIREATGSRLGSSGWFRAWEREGIEHIAAGQRVKPKPEKPAPAAKPKPATKKPSARKPAARKPSGDAVKPATAA